VVHEPLSGAARSGPIDLEEALSGGPALGRALKTIKEQLRAVPGKGLGYGLLRYLNSETAAELAGLPVPQLGFNYLGRFAAGGAGADWAPATLHERGWTAVTGSWPAAAIR
jgi:non-ribosomal peptide synthase protein (TIGR01720 family)